MNWQKACKLLFACCMVLCASLAVGQGVADPSLVFQLEGNLRTDTDICFQLSASGALTVPSNLGSCPAGYTDVVFAARTEDWDKIASGTSSASAKSYISPSTTPAEAINSSGDDIFTAGGSKDTLGISTGPWKWKNGKPQAKDDIEDAFAAAYTLPGVVNGSLQACGGANQPNCDTAVYFGMTRYDNSGASTAGFWFFQDGSVALSGGTGNPPTCGGSGCAFSGHHTDRDMLIVSDFTQGGLISTITVYLWRCSGTGATCDSSGSLVLDSTISTNATCDPTTHTSGICSIVNGNSQTVPAVFGFTDKSGNSNSMLLGEALEGGVDLQVLFPGGVPCFSTFMAETRSSQSPTATLSDVTAPVSFPLCGASIDKTCLTGTFADGGTDVLYTFSGTIKNTGIGTITNLVVSDTPGGNFIAGTLSLTQPSSTTLAPGATTTYSGSFKATSASSTQPNEVFLAAMAAGQPISGCAQDSTKAACASWIVPPATALPQACTPTPGPLALTKSCTAAVVPVSGALEIAVNFSGQITNNSGVRVSGISVTDNPTTGGSACTSSTISVTYPAGQSFLNPGQVATYSGCYTPTTCTTNDQGVCAFTDTAQAQGTGAAGTGTISSNSQGATCHLCPVGVCSQGP